MRSSWPESTLRVDALRSWLFVEGANASALERAASSDGDVLICPYTWSDAAGCEADTRKARRLGYRAKSTVIIEHAAIINRVLTPDAKAVAHAHRVVHAFEAARKQGEGRVEVDGALVELPIYLNARRLLERARAINGA